VLAFIVLQALDILTTVLVIRVGGGAELNPLICKFVAQFGLIGGLITAKVLAVAIALRLRKLLPVANLLFAAVVAWNLLVLVGLHWRVF
jgi:uncharacterized protein DUF5658